MNVRFWPIAAYHLLKLNVRFQYKADIRGIKRMTPFWHVADIRKALNFI